LEHGLLEAALDVDNITLHTASDDDEDSRDETIPELEGRVNLFVMVHLSKASGSKRDHYKDSLVYQARKDLIQEFLRSTITKKCSNEGCGA
jgi:DNA-directed RNA polymerase I subunit RPA1